MRSEVEEWLRDAIGDIRERISEIRDDQRACRQGCDRVLAKLGERVQRVEGRLAGLATAIAGLVGAGVIALKMAVGYVMRTLGGGS